MRGLDQCSPQSRLGENTLLGTGTEQGTDRIQDRNGGVIQNMTLNTEKVRIFGEEKSHQTKNT